MSVQRSTIFRSVNPKNNKLMRSHEPILNKQLETLTNLAYNRFRFKQALGVSEVDKRGKKLEVVMNVLNDRRDYYAKLITTEVGKPLAQSHGEIDSCIRHLQYYIDHSEKFMQDEQMTLMNGQKASILNQPLGPVLGKSFLSNPRSNYALELSILGAF